MRFYTSFTLLLLPVKPHFHFGPDARYCAGTESGSINVEESSEALLNTFQDSVTSTALINFWIAADLSGHALIFCN